MARVTYKQLDQVSFGDLEVYSVLPEHPIWSRVKELIDFSFADQICAPLYSSFGPRPYAPSLKLKIHIVQRYYNLSDRAMEEKIMGDLFIKRFLDVPVSFIGIDHSTLGLDRERVGSNLFDACHHYILAQAKQQGLWGDNKDVWLVDSFPTHGNIARRSAYRLIKQAILRVVNQLKRAHSFLFHKVQSELPLQSLAVTPSASTPEEWAAAFNQLVVLAYRLLDWFEGEEIRSIFWSWTKPEQQLTSLELQAILYRILTENVSPKDPTNPEDLYKKLGRDQRPTDRVISAVDPDVRRGTKNKHTKIMGDKVQVVTSALHGIVLNAEPIPANENDGDRLIEIIQAVRQKQNVKPLTVVGDSAYGYGSHRQTLPNDGIALVAPLRVIANPTGLLRNEQFTYDSEFKSVTCPAGQVTQQGHYNKGQEGKQYVFLKLICKICAMQPICTTNKKTGRTLFISDYYEEFQKAKIYNETEEGKAFLDSRLAIERKNHEMKNHNGLGRARYRSREKRRSDVKIVSMVVNLKQMVKQIGSITMSFTRKKLPPIQGPLVPIFQVMNG